MRSLALTARVLSPLLAALAAWVVTQGAGALAQDSKVTPAAIRAVQIGLLPDLKKIPAEEKLLDDLKVVANVARIRQRPGGINQFEPQFTGGAGVARDSFKKLAKITFIDASGLADLCTGLFLGDDFTRVLTAAHCSCGRDATYRIYRGDHPHKNEDGRPDIRKDDVYVLSTSPIRYDQYSCQLPPEAQPGLDLALLRVEQLDNTVGKTFLPTPNEILVPFAIGIATMGQVYADSDTKRLVGAGFGYDDIGNLPKSAIAAAIPIGSFFCSAGVFAASRCASFREFVLADPRTHPASNRPDSCGGDSGSPIFWVPRRFRKDMVEPFLVGIASRALAGVSHNPGTTCGAGGIYTAVGHPDVIRWLASLGIFVRTEMALELGGN